MSISTCCTPEQGGSDFSEAEGYTLHNSKEQVADGSGLHGEHNWS
jgi:hypothetical protein